MIAGLSGYVFEKDEHGLVIDVGGVRYECLASLTTLASLPPVGEEAEIMVYTHMREGEISLFGFSNLHEKHLFKILIGVSGIGPRVALGMLSVMPPQDLASIIVKADLIRLKSIPGIGKKTAERIVVELQDKLAKWLEIMPGDSVARLRLSNSAELYSALLNLGYKPRAVDLVVAEMEKTHSADTKLEILLRDALSELQRR